MCRGGACGEFTTERTHLGFVYTRPDPKLLFDPHGQLAIRVLLQAETTENAMPADAAREELTREVQDLLANVQLDELTRPYSH